MSEFVIATFPNAASAAAGSNALKQLRAHGMVIYGMAAVAKDSEGKFTVLDRTPDHSHAGAVAALIGALAGLPIGALPAIIGAAAGALVGISADLTDRGVGRHTLEKLSRDLDDDMAAVIADIEGADLESFSARMRELGASISLAS